jgi:hypothetical protein
MSQSKKDDLFEEMVRILEDILEAAVKTETMGEICQKSDFSDVRKVTQEAKEFL